MVKIDKRWWKSTKIVLFPTKMVLPPSKMVLLASKMVLPQAMAWVQYWFRVLSLKFCEKSKKICGDISPQSPAFCMYDCALQMHIQHCTMYLTFYIVQIVPHNVTTANPSPFLRSAYLLWALDTAFYIFHVLSIQHCTSHFTLCPLV